MRILPPPIQRRAGTNTTAPAGSTVLTERLLALWGDVVPQDQVRTFLRTGGYVTELWPGVQALVLNSLYGDAHNWFDWWVEDPAEQFQWAHGRVDAARRRGGYIVVLAHIPPNTAEARSTYAQALCRLAVVAGRGVVIAVFFGHTHKDSAVLWSRGCAVAPAAVHTRAVPAAVGYVVPSLMPDGHEPALRVVLLSRRTGEVVDYLQREARLGQRLHQQARHGLRLRHGVPRHLRVPLRAALQLRNAFCWRERPPAPAAARRQGPRGRRPVMAPALSAAHWHHVTALG